MKLDELIEEKRLTLDITPLVDVVFLLVLFFAVTSSFIQPDQLQELKQKLAAMVTENQQIQNDRSENQTEIGRLQLQISQERAELSRQQQKARELTLQMAAVTADMSRLDDEKNKLTMQLGQQGQAARKTEKNLQTTIETQIERIRILDLDLQKARATVRSGQIVQSQMAAQLEARHRTLDERDARIRQLEKALQDARMAVAALETDKTGILNRQKEHDQATREQQAQLNLTLSRHTDRIRQLEADLAARTDDNTRLRTRNEAIQAELGQQRQTSLANNRRLLDLQRINASQAANIQEYEIQIQNLNQLVDHQSQKLQAIEQQTQNYRQMIVKQQQAMGEVNTKMKRVMAENEKLFRLASTREEALNEQIKEFQQLKQKTVALEARNQQHKKMLQVERQQMDRLLQVQQNINTDLGEVLKAHNIGVHRKQDRIVLELSDKIIFDAGSETVKPEGLQVLQKMGAILQSSAQDMRIQVAGHTDNVPVRPGAKFHSNWELSAQRAVNVVLFLQKQVGIAPGRLAAAGYGQHLPIATNDTPEGRALNRRIEIVLQPQ